eukprot:250849-Chlamydomonas_euryale.AAC.6
MGRARRALAAVGAAPGGARMGISDMFLVWTSDMFLVGISDMFLGHAAVAAVAAFCMPSHAALGQRTMAAHRMLPPPSARRLNPLPPPVQVHGARACSCHLAGTCPAPHSFLPGGHVGLSSFRLLIWRARGVEQLPPFNLVGMWGRAASPFQTI